MRTPKQSLTAVLTVALAAAWVAGMTTTSAAPPPSPWFQSGWNQSRTADNPQEAALTAANAARLHPVWSVSVPSAGLTLTSVDSANGSAFFQGGADNHLYAVNTSTGASTWNFSTPGCSEVLSPPAIHLGVLVESAQACQSGASYLSGYDVATGRTLWTRRPQFSQAVPITENGRVYTEAPIPHSNKVQISALDVHTGAVVWSVTRGPAVGIDSFQLAADSTHLYLSSPTYTQALNPANGAVDWIRKVAGGQQILVSSGHVVVAGIGVLTSFSAGGTQQWQSRPAFNSVSATAGELVLSDFSGTVEALSPDHRASDVEHDHLRRRVDVRAAGHRGRGHLRRNGHRPRSCGVCTAGRHRCPALDRHLRYRRRAVGVRSRGNAVRQHRRNRHHRAAPLTAQRPDSAS